MLQATEEAESLALIRLQSIKMDLPTGQQATRSNRKDIVNLTVRKTGDIYIDNKTLVTSIELHSFLSKQFQTNANIAVYITGDPDATHGMMIDTLDLVRQDGIQKVSFAIAPAAQLAKP